MANANRFTLPSRDIESNCRTAEYGVRFGRRTIVQCDHNHRGRRHQVRWMRQ